MTLFTISQIANEFGITPRAIRFYEDKGLITPERRGQVRVYSGRDRGRLVLILRGKRFGFSLRDIKEMLDLHERPDGGVEQLQVTRRKAEERIADMEAQKAELETSIAELRAGIAQIDQRLAALSGDPACAQAAAQ